MRRASVGVSLAFEDIEAGADGTAAIVLPWRTDKIMGRTRLILLGCGVAALVAGVSACSATVKANAGASCESSSDCATGACIVTGSGIGACTPTCSISENSCGAQETCSGVGSLSVGTCAPASAPPAPAKRVPCHDDKDCSSLMAGAVCATWDGETACTLPCTSNATCNPIPEISLLSCASDQENPPRQVCLPRQQCLSDPLSCVSNVALPGIDGGFPGLDAAPPSDDAAPTPDDATPPPADASLACGMQFTSNASCNDCLNEFWLWPERAVFREQRLRGARDVPGRLSAGGRQLPGRLQQRQPKRRERPAGRERVLDPVLRGELPVVGRSRHCLGRQDQARSRVDVIAAVLQARRCT